jgi:hypothetical protein
VRPSTTPSPPLSSLSKEKLEGRTINSKAETSPTYISTYKKPEMLKMF